MRGWGREWGNCNGMGEVGAEVEGQPAGILDKIPLLAFTRRREFLLVEIITLISGTLHLREIVIWRTSLTTSSGS